MSKLGLSSRLAEIAGAAHEVTSYAELADEVVPRVSEAFRCSGWTLVGATADRPFDVLRASVEEGLMQEYVERWFMRDPLNAALLHRAVDPVLPLSRLPQWPKIERYPIYCDIAPAWGLKWFLHLNLSDAGYLARDWLGIFLMRPPRNLDFTPDDVLGLSQVLPALRAAQRRCARAARARTEAPLLEALLVDAAPGARALFAADGRVVWRSPEAERLLARSRLPASLVAAARQAAASSEPPAPLHLPGPKGERVVAELRRLRTRDGELCVVAHLCCQDPSADLRERFGLTGAEAEVLRELGRGKSNGEIARARSVSPATVHSQVARVLEKLGVHTRLEAALVALGRKAP